MECKRDKEIDYISKVLNGNGKAGLITLTNRLSDKVDNLSKSVETIQSNVEVLVRFQTQIETKEKQGTLHEQKIEQIKHDEMVNKRWRIGLTISTILGMLGIIISLLAINYNEPEQSGVTEDEFRQLWENYKKDHNVRGDTTYYGVIK